MTCHQQVDPDKSFQRLATVEDEVTQWNAILRATCGAGDPAVYRQC